MRISKIGIVLLIVLIVFLVAAAVMFRCDHQWQEATCDSPSVCSLCKSVKGAPLGHDWKEATCAAERQCSRCQALQGEKLAHQPGEATCTEAGVCSVCNEIVVSALGHDWQEATCQSAKSCRRCGVKEGSALAHTWSEATCDRAKTCTVCQATEGQALGHTWQEATCLSSEICSRCGLTQGEAGSHRYREASCTAPKTCQDCGHKEGSALGHQWQEATCTLAKTCSRCKTTSGSPLGHTYADGDTGANRTCTRCNQSVGKKYVAITFDDGPSGQVTQGLLDGLAQRGVKATFFLCGYRIKTYPSLPQAIYNGGHEIGLHTQNHATLTSLDTAGIRQELEGMLHYLPEGCQVKLMRPPGGSYNNTVKSVCADLGLSLIMWSVDPRDWASSDSAAISASVVKSAYDGSIILMHDLRSSSVNAALSAIDQLKAQGYEFVTVSELAAIKGHSLQAGQVYNSFR